MIARPRYLLPPTAYTSQAWLEHERDSLFAGQWALVASADELISPGDYATAVVGRAPLVVIRGEDGELRAFHNLCRHRGMVMLSGSGNVGRTVNCFYHQWRYALDGALQVVPQRNDQFPDLDPAQWGLLPTALEVWEGMVFVHPDPHAAPLAGSLLGVAEHLGSFRPGLLHQVAVRRLDARCNWKLFVENHVDVYHLWHLHSDSLGDFDHTRFEWGQTAGNWTSYEPLRHADGSGLEAAALTAGTVPIAHLDERDRNGLGAHLVFPNLMMASASEFFATYRIEPVAPDRSVVELRIRAEAEADAERLLAAAESFIVEDIGACEAIQVAVASPAFSVGPMARDHEAPIEAFHRQLLVAMGADG